MRSILAARPGQALVMGLRGLKIEKQDQSIQASRWRGTSDDFGRSMTL
jgi:hypothetical protein